MPIRIVNWHLTALSSSVVIILFCHML